MRINDVVPPWLRDGNYLPVEPIDHENKQIHHSNPNAISVLAYLAVRLIYGSRCYQEGAVRQSRSGTAQVCTLQATKE